MPLTLTEEAEIFGRYIGERAWANLEDDATFAVFRSSIYNDKSIDWGAMSAISCPKRKLAYLLWRYLKKPLKAAEMCQHLYGLKAEPPDKPWDASTAWALTKAAISRVKAENGYQPMAGEKLARAQQQDTDEFFNNLGKPYEACLLARAIQVSRKQDWFNAGKTLNTFTEFRFAVYAAKEIQWHYLSPISWPKRKLVYLLWRSIGGSLYSESVKTHVASLVGWEAELVWVHIKAAIDKLESEGKDTQEHLNGICWEEPIEQQPTAVAEFLSNNLGKPYEGRTTEFRLDPSEAKEKTRTATQTLKESYGTATGRISSSQPALQQLEKPNYAALEIREWALAGGRRVVDPWKRLEEFKPPRRLEVSTPGLHEGSIIADYFNRPGTEFFPREALTKFKRKETDTMNKPFETRRYSYGTDVSKLSDQNLIAAIKTAEGELASLRTIAVKSATIKGLKASLKTAITNLVQALDKTNNFTEGTTMSEAFKTVNYVYGTDITTMSTNSLIAAIKKAETERGALDAVQADSKKIEALKAEITAAIAKMVEALDART